MTEPQNSLLKKVPPLDMEKWRAIVSDWESSKENQKEYCERLGISLNTFTYARGKIIQSKKMRPAFIPVTINQTRVQDFSGTDIITIESPQGCKLRISSALSLDRLAKIFKLCGW